MAKQKKETSRNVEFAKGGNTPMFSQQAAESAIGKEGHTADPTSADKGVHEHGGAKGGSTKMFGFAASQPATAGITSAR
jgi:hypothetical protein